MRLEHHLVGGYVRYISPHIIIIIIIVLSNFSHIISHDVYIITIFTLQVSFHSVML